MVNQVYVDIAEEDLRQDVLQEAIAGRVPSMTPSAALPSLLTSRSPTPTRRRCCRTRCRIQS